MKFSKAQRLPLRLYNCGELGWAVDHVPDDKSLPVIVLTYVLIESSSFPDVTQTCTGSKRPVNTGLNPVSINEHKRSQPANIKLAMP